MVGLPWAVGGIITHIIVKSAVYSQEAFFGERLP